MPEPVEPPDRRPPVAPREPVQRWRLVLARGPLDADHAQRAQQAAWEAALLATGLPVACLDPDGQRPRVVMAAPLAAAIPGAAELVDVWLVERVPRWRAREAFGGSLPDGWRLVDLYDVWLGEAALPGQVVGSVYRATLDTAGDDRSAALSAAAKSLLAAPSLPRERQKPDRTIAYDLRPFVEDLVLRPRPDGALDLMMDLRHDPERGVGRPDEVLAEIGDRLGAPLRPRELVRERLVLAPERAAPSSAQAVASRVGARPAGPGRRRPR